jgi:hypothetical protein
MTNIVNNDPFGSNVDAAYVAKIAIAPGRYPGGVRYELVVEVGGKFVTYNGDVVDTLEEAGEELVSEFTIDGKVTVTFTKAD